MVSVFFPPFFFTLFFSLDKLPFSLSFPPPRFFFLSICDEPADQFVTLHFSRPPSLSSRVGRRPLLQLVPSLPPLAIFLLDLENEVQTCCRRVFT